MKKIVSIAPMMDCTDRHDRYFLRLISKHVKLYTEMIVANAIIKGDRKRLLKFNPKEKEGVNSVDSYPLWGSYVMKRNERLTGFLVFEVDKKFAPDTFTWKSSDNVIIHFIQ